MEILIIDHLFFELIKVSLGQRNRLSRCPNETEWEELYAICQQQTVAGVAFPAFEQLSKQGQRPPQDLLFDWLGLSEQIKAQNVLMNKEAARLTRIFEDAGHRTAILKGQANARLYCSHTDGTDHTDKSCHTESAESAENCLALLRQPGDIDIWVDGGRTKVVDMLMRTGLLSEAPVFSNVGNPKKASASYHHVHLPDNEQGVTVEVHFRPSLGNNNPFTNRRLQKFLMREIQNRAEVKEGFYVPSTAFALVMQLAHIQRHFFSEGIGMRQVMDYYFLLKTGNNLFRMENEELRDFLRSLGLEKMAGAMMWVLGEVMHMDERLMICKPDARRGEWLLHDMLAGGNFGRYANASDGLWRRFFKARLRQLKMIRFDFWEGIWAEIFFWKNFVKRIPLRMKYRTWSLNRVNQKLTCSLS